MIQSNYSAMTAIANISNTNSLLEKSLQRLTTGKRINSASDDVSGLAIADKLRTQSSSLSMSITNANNAKAMIKIADGAMKETSDSLDLIKTKLIKAASSTTSDEGRESIRKDIAKLLKSIDETAKNTTYNGMQLLAKADGSATDALNFQIGETSSSVVSTDGGVRANSKDVIIGEFEHGKCKIDPELFEEKAWNISGDELKAATEALSSELNEAMGGLPDSKEYVFRANVENGKITKIKLRRRIAFGPALSVGLAVGMLCGETIIKAYLSML
jgi:flagellin-like hook-associated protein FlgL